LLALAAGCGAPRYSAIRILQPASTSDSEVTVGSLQLQVRLGDEWIELHAENRGSTPIGIDFGEIQFSEQTGMRHSLVTVGRIGLELSAYQYVDGTARYASSSVNWSGPRTAPHTAPFALQVLASSVRVLRPGERAEEILYPAEHLTLEGSHFVASPLFCRIGSLVDRSTFELVVPLQQSGRWTLLQITAARVGR
jgi:hypothetical protein